MDRQTIFLIILILALAGGGWIWYQSQQQPAIDTAGPTADIVEIEARMTEIRRLKNATLDTTILQDPLFKSLKDITATSGPTVSPGRINPFAPL